MIMTIHNTLYLSKIKPVMKKALCILCLTLIGFTSLGQDKTDKLTKPIVEEGKRLYKSEMASWYGTDIFVAKYKEREKIGGYLSYAENDTVTKCVFFSKDEKPMVIGTMTFDPSFSVETAQTDLGERELTTKELELYTIRKKALATINSDTLFKRYQNTSLNLIPLISNGEKKVYVLTAPQKDGVVIFGNDYLLTFDDKNNLKDRKKIHKSLIPMEYENSVSGIHSHVPETGDFITATDICTLMLYEKFAKWEAHYVMSKKYVSIWNCKKDELFIMTTKAFEKIAKSK